jgi:spore coat-associated protein N
MKSRILYGVMGMALVALLVGGGTYAYFSDTETSTGNTFSAGTLDLTVGSTDPTTEKIAFNSLKPGDTSGDVGVTPIAWEIKNTGTIAGTLTIACGAITNNENGLTEPEVEKSDTDTTGELGANLTVAFWVDSNANNTWDTGDYYLTTAGGKTGFSSEASLPTGAYAHLNDYDGKTWASLTTLTGGASAGTFHVEYGLPGETGNEVQSDSCTFDLTFRLEQVHP